ncbi:MAG TPA: MaoC family dehydratase [Gammaproteobacteria bacterium]
MSNTRTKQQLLALVGEELGTSEWFVVDQDRIDRFADVTEDHQFIHVDPVKARDAGFGGTIAHGMLTLSLIVGFCNRFAPELEGSTMVINYGFDKVRFAAPVKVNDRIRAVAVLADARERGGHMLIKAKVTIEIEGESRPALVAEWLTMHIVSDGS